MLRSALIMPGLVIAGIRDKRLITGALASSTLVSLFLVLYTVTERGRKGMKWGRTRHRHRNGLAARRQHALAVRRRRAAAARGELAGLAARRQRVHQLQHQRLRPARLSAR